ncbi:TBC1 domain family member 12-like [Planococcus citri]|uniref:TBC1 domain family member 12-like n=1 Tax=Planococcus citri TaxID=170843 RepID=UPI0031F998D9
MNGLLVNSYHTTFNSAKPEVEEKKPINRTHYHTWPRKRKSSRKRKISHIIQHIKKEHAISEICLNIQTIDNICFSFDVTNNKDASTNDESKVIKPDNDQVQKSSNCLEENNNQCTASSDCLSYTENLDCVVIDRSPSEDVFNEDNLGIIKILKDWKVNKNNHEKSYKSSGAFSDSVSSISSLNTFNESDSISFASDIPYTSTRVSRYQNNYNKTISSTHLIQMDRPSNLPPKPLSEQMKHQKEYEKMVEAIQKKERDKDIMLKKRRNDRLKEEEKLAQATSIWLNEILPNWRQMRNSKKTRNLWWNGLPPCIRGKVWSLAIGNKLEITGEQYKECVKKSKEILKNGSKDSLHMNESYEHSVELIRLDISRTFPQLCIFQQGGPYYEVLHCLLGAYVCYQPEIGYVQGMSFIAAVLLLNMEELDAFICFANMLDMPCHKAFYSLDVQKMKKYYLAYTDLLRVNIYELYTHFSETALSPDLYLVDWVYTLFSKSMNLDLACRIWDIIIRDGETFIFRAALGIMHLNKNELLKMDFLRAAQYLTKLPDDICPNQLFKSISCINMSNGSFTFEDLLTYYEDLIA